MAETRAITDEIEIKTVSELNQASALTGNELIFTSQNDEGKKTTVNEINDFIKSKADNTPTGDSSNLITSKGVENALKNYTEKIIADCNSMNSTFGKTTSATLNTPYKQGLVGFTESMIITTRYSSAMATYTTQLSITSGSGAIYRRYKNTGDWSSWEKLTTESEIYYKSGDKITINNRWFSGVLTNSKKTVYTSIPLIKKIPSSATINISKISLRQNGNYIFGSGSIGSDECTFNGNITLNSIDDTGFLIGITFPESLATAVNNDTVSVQMIAEITVG